MVFSQINGQNIEKDDGVLIFDDTWVKKPEMNENDIVTWHFDPGCGRTVKGLNYRYCLYQTQDTSGTKAFEIISKPWRYSDIKTRQVKRYSEVTKNDWSKKCYKPATKINYVTNMY